MIFYNVCLHFIFIKHLGKNSVLMNKVNIGKYVSLSPRIEVFCCNSNAPLSP